MTQPITGYTVTSFAAELAELLVSVESTQSDSAQLQRAAARKDFLAQAQHQIQALREAADDVREGAFVSAAFTLAGAACSVGSALNQYDADSASAELCRNAPKTDAILDDELAARVLTSISKTMDSLSGPAKSLIGDAPAADANANAKFFETLAEQSRWVQGDASTEIDKAAKLADKILDLLQGINQDQNSANNALIGRI